MDALAGKVTVVTGGGRGIGRAVALEMATHGAKVVVCDLYEDGGVLAADQVADEIVARGGAAVAVQTNVAEEASAQEAVDTAIKEFGQIDSIVNCAGNHLVKAFADTSAAQWDSIMDVHVRGHFYCTRAAVRAMRDRGSGGRVVNFSSRGAFRLDPARPSAAYSVAKAAILGLTSALAVELAELGITANAIIPSADTQLFPGTGGARRSRGLPATISLDPDYIAPFVAFLATDAAAGITGRFVYVSGGDICLYPTPLNPDGCRLVRKAGKWSMAELMETVPAVCDV